MAKRSALASILYSIRPSACLGVALFATAGLGRWNEWWVVLLTFLCGFIGGAGCFLINDVFDREKDLQNKKLRPIATGELPVRTAIIISVLCCLFMLVGAGFLSIFTTLAAALLIVGFWLYSYINQRFGLLANLWVAACSSLAFLCGAMVYELSTWVVLAIISCFFVNTGREILLDALDQPGDRAVGKPSVPLVWGEQTAKLVVALLFLLATLAMCGFSYFFPATWTWIGLLIVSLWMPFFLKRGSAFTQWALFNVRSSHLFFVILIILLFIRP